MIPAKMLFLCLLVSSTAYAGSASKLVDLQTQQKLVEAEAALQKSRNQLNKEMPAPVKLQEQKPFGNLQFYVDEIYGLDDDLTAVLITADGGRLHARVGAAIADSIVVSKIAVSEVILTNKKVPNSKMLLPFYADRPRESAATTPSGFPAQRVTATTGLTTGVEPLKLLPPPSLQ